MNKIPTAKEYLQTLRDKCLVDFVRASDRVKVEEGLIEFAKLHVEAALKKADYLSEIKMPEGSWEDIDDKDFILNAYPLDNIK